MNISRHCFLFVPVLLLFQSLSAQNLVPNGSFEDYTVCPGSYSRQPAEFRVPGWRSVSAGSPDYFNVCSEGEAAVPYNWAGVSDAFHGYGYVGIYTWMNLPKDYREYLHCRLAAPLQKDARYHVEFRYKLSSYSKYSTDRIGLLLSDSLSRYAHDRPLDIQPSVTFVKDSALDRETGAWELASAEYRAKGGEQFLTIGNFSNNAETHFYRIQFRPESQPMLAQSAYYYIDDVKVIPLLSALPERVEPLAFTGDTPELNRTYILKNIQFAFNSYALKPVSFIDLDKVVSYLLDHKEVNVRLSGHTDDTGSEQYNRVLSANRAESAAAYLIAKGIDESRIATRGYGERLPLVDEESEAARQINRRVEIEFLAPNQGHRSPGP